MLFKDKMILTGLALMMLCNMPDLIAEEQDFDDIITKYERTIDNGQVYTPFPPATPPESLSQPVNKPWYKKIFSPFVKHANPPINQPAKVQKEPGRETVPLSDPLIRLGRTVIYEGKTIPPGFYLLGLQPEDNTRGAFLKLLKKQHTVLEVPAMALAPSQATTLSVANTVGNLTPTEESTAINKEPAIEKGNSTRKNEEALGTVEISQNGETLILVYQKGNRHYTSIPLNILSNLQP